MAPMPGPTSVLPRAAAYLFYWSGCAQLMAASGERVQAWSVAVTCLSRHPDAEATGRHALAINRQRTSAKNEVKTALLLPSPWRDVW